MKRNERLPQHRFRTIPDCIEIQSFDIIRSWAQRLQDTPRSNWRTGLSLTATCESFYETKLSTSDIAAYSGSTRRKQVLEKLQQRVAREVASDDDKPFTRREN